MKELITNFSRELSEIRAYIKILVILMTICVVSMISIIVLTIYIHLEESDSMYHFYMNTKKSLECIHDVQIDSYDGNIAHVLTTEEQLVRRQNRKFHLRYLFK